MDINVNLIPNLSGCTRYFLANISRNMADREKLSMGINIGAEKSILRSKMNKFGPVVPEMWAKKWSKSGQIEVPERFFEKISRNITDTEKICCRQEIWEFTNFHQISSM